MASNTVRAPITASLLRGRFILSLNDTPEVRATFAGFDIDSVGTHYGNAGAGMAPAREVIITG